ncbi:hypothetical protein Tsubulata_008071 [Turnera subulata]|uniref:Uncharacterized protein n=1 Tax=Turnera subulata TaxID=218843 RepID=A0A9Q0FL19_9ROSI|nr:hypothetical protein Tsubulata_008071 [Turnera subulata]
MSKKMQEAKHKSTGGNEDSSKKKERHIVTWTQQEDDILRQQIALHGTENWTIIASKFKDKTTRQCRRRWYTYLNSDFKKGGWSPEEDLLLCEAQKIFGNRWTEIAKVVSGRTDNAVKNRFSTLCKKRAKYEALAKENKSTYMNSNNKRVIIHSGFHPDNEQPAKKIRRPHITDPAETCHFGDRSHLRTGNQQHRPPFAVLAQNFHNLNMANQHPVSNAMDVPVDEIFITPSFSVVLQLKAVVQDFLNRSKENDILGYKISDIDFQLEDFKDLIEDLRNSNDGSQASWGQPELYEESASSSEYSTGSTLMPFTAPDKTEDSHNGIIALQKDIESEFQSVYAEEPNSVVECDKEIISSANMSEGEILPSCDEKTNINIVISASSTTDFSSPLQVTPLFRSLAAGIPSPKFSESEFWFAVAVGGFDHRGEEFPIKNTRSGISLLQPNHQSFPATTLQKSSPSESITNLPDPSHVENVVQPNFMDPPERYTIG